MMSDIKKALIAIAQGYPVEAADDRYIIVENPDYKPDNGSPPNLVIDTADLEGLTQPGHSINPTASNALTIKRKYG